MALVAILGRVRLVLIGNVGERNHQVLEASLDRRQPQGLKRELASVYASTALALIRQPSFNFPNSQV